MCDEHFWMSSWSRSGWSVLIESSIESCRRFVGLVVFGLVETFPVVCFEGHFQEVAAASLNAMNMWVVSWVMDGCQCQGVVGIRSFIRLDGVYAGARLCG